MADRKGKKRLAEKQVGKERQADTTHRKEKGQQERIRNADLGGGEEEGRLARDER
jgi:hypothetical protein